MLSRVSAAPNSIEGGCTAVLIAPDVALTAAHCARGPVSGPDAMRLTFRPDTTPPAFAVTVRAVAFHAEQRNDGLSTETAHADLALLRLAMPVPPRGGAAHPAGDRAGTGERCDLRVRERRR